MNPVILYWRQRYQYELMFILICMQIDTKINMDVYAYIHGLVESTKLHPQRGSRSNTSPVAPSTPGA